VAARLSNGGQWDIWQTELEVLLDRHRKLDQPLDRELFLQVKGALPSLADCNRRLLALEQWLPLATSWKRFFAFTAKKNAMEALAPFALPLAPDSVERARAFYHGLKARYLVSDL